MFAPLRKELLLGSGGDFAAPDQQRLSLKQFRPELGGVGKHVNAPALLVAIRASSHSRVVSCTFQPITSASLLFYSALRQDRRKYS